MHITAKTYAITIDGEFGMTHTIPKIPGHYLAEFAVDEIHVDKSHGEKACSDNNITRIAALTSNHGGYFKELSCANQEYEVTSEFYCQKCAPGFLPNSANTTASKSRDNSGCTSTCQDTCRTSNVNDWNKKCTWTTVCAGCAECAEIVTAGEDGGP